MGDAMRNPLLVMLFAGCVTLPGIAAAQDTAPAMLQPTRMNASSASALDNEISAPAPIAKTNSTGPTLSRIPSSHSATAIECSAVDSAAISELVRKVAADEGIDPELADAVAWVESNHGAARRASSAGAMGIMQLMPDTARDLGVADRCDAEANIRGGVKYLKQLQDEFGDPLLMIAAYNAGPRNVYRKQGIPDFDETSKYIVRVLNRWKLSAKVSPSKTAKLATTNEEIPNENIWKEGHVIEIQ